MVPQHLGGHVSLTSLQMILPIAWITFISPNISPFVPRLVAEGDAAGHCTIDGCATSKGCIATGWGWKKVFTYKSWMHVHLNR